MREHLSTSYKHILDSLTIGEVEIKHRIMVTGHTQLYGSGNPKDLRYASRNATIEEGWRKFYSP